MTLVCTNRTDLHRMDVVRTRHFFQPGEVTTTAPSLRLKDVDATPFLDVYLEAPLHPDGSRRSATVYAPTRLRPNSQRRMILASDADELVPRVRCRVSPWAQAALSSGFRFDYLVDGRLAPFTWHTVAVGKHHALQYLRARDQETGFWCDAFLDYLDNLDHAKLSVMTGWSTPDDPRTNLPAGPSVELLVSGASVAFRERKLAGQRRVDERSWIYRLADAGQEWNDTQAAEFYGSLLFPPPPGTDLEDPAARDRIDTLEAETQLPVSVMSETADVGYGPFAFVPRHTGDTAGAALEMAVDAHRRVPRDYGPFAHGEHGCEVYPGQAGDQPDFGTGQLYQVVDSMTPDLIDVVRFSVSSEAGRPVNQRDVDGSLLLTADHPGWLTWTRRTHYHPSYPVRLGKPSQPWGRGAVDPISGRPIEGHDAQHNSVLYLAAHALLTSEPRSVDLCEAWTQTYLSEQPINSGTPLDYPGAPRAIGRSSLSGAWVYLATGNEDLRERLARRWAESVAQYAYSPGAESAVLSASAAPRAMVSSDALAMGIVPSLADDAPDPRDVAQVVTPGGITLAAREAAPNPASVPTGESTLYVLAVAPSDPRTLPEPNWSPWQDAFGAMGGVAVAMILPEDDPRRDIILDICRKVCRNVVLYGVGEVEDGRWEPGYNVAWNAGEPLTEDEWRAEARVIVDPGFRTWVAPAVTLAIDLEIDHETTDRAKTLLEQWVPERKTFDDWTRWLGARCAR